MAQWYLWLFSTIGSAVSQPPAPFQVSPDNLEMSSLPTNSAAAGLELLYPGR